MPQINRVVNASAPTPTIAPTVPSHDAIPHADPVELKRRARLAWQRARVRSALSPAVCDRLWSETLLATRTAPARVVATMMYRSEVLFSLLTDRANWLRHEDAPQAATPHPRTRAGRMPRWDRR
jgi:hypothetical protein